MTPAELRAAMRALPEPLTDKTPPHWEAWQHDLWERVVWGGNLRGNPDKFWEWPCIYHTMLQFHWMNLIQIELESLYGYPDLHDLVMPPKNGVFDYLPDTMFSANLVKQLYHISQYERVTGNRIADLSNIVEFGAGYGAMPLLIHRLGFRGNYHIVELREFSLLQQYYLSNTGEVDMGKIEWYSAVGIFPDNPGGLPIDLFIALYSLSEAPLSTRVFPPFWNIKDQLLLYSNRFAEYDNVALFQEYMEKRGGNWRTWVIEHMPPESIYSVGWTE